MRNEFETLIDEVRECRVCDRMCGSRRIFGHSSGSVGAPIMVIGEAPGRLGADDSAIPFHGDKAGQNFELLIEMAGISRYEIFVTNAVLCNPKDDNGNNATPTRKEVEACSKFLKRQIELVSPQIIITLGAQALGALANIEDHNFTLSGSIRKRLNWLGRDLFALYHPGQRAMIHRSFFNQLSDYKTVADRLRDLKGSPRKRTESATSEIVAKIAERILQICGTTSYFSLHKIFYLLEVEHFKSTGNRLTSAYIVRQKDGPYVFELNYKKLKKALIELEFQTKNEILYLKYSSDSQIRHQSSDLFGEVLDELDADIEVKLRELSSKTDAQLKTLAYLTRPMKEILKQERSQKRAFYNMPVDFSSYHA
jgi:uracil-DNA glycosylase family 4